MQARTSYYVATPQLGLPPHRGVGLAAREDENGCHRSEVKRKKPKPSVTFKKPNPEKAREAAICVAPPRRHTQRVSEALGGLLL